MKKDRLKEKVKTLETVNCVLFMILIQCSPNPGLIIESMKAVGDEELSKGRSLFTPQVKEYILTLAEETENITNKILDQDIANRDEN